MVPGGLHMGPNTVLREAWELLTVTHSSHLKRKSRPWIAMIAAYAVALQMLLSAAVASQMAAAAPSGASPICYGASLAGGGTGQGDAVLLHEASCILCSIGLSAPVDLAVASVAPAYCVRCMIVEDVAASPSLAQAPPSPRLSQGPPQTV